MIIELEKLKKDLKNATKTLSTREVRFLVDLYYQIQEYRKRSKLQMDSLQKNDEPHELLGFFFENTRILENQIKSAMDSYTDSVPIGQWAKSICGIGPVISAGLISIIDIKKCPTAGHIWSYAGLNPEEITKWYSAKEAKTIVDNIVPIGIASDIEINALNNLINRDIRSFMAFLKLEKPTKENLAKALSMRPWNSLLKTLCWKLGESFVKVSNNDKDIYGKIYQKRKQYENEKNEKGEYEPLALKRSKEVGKATDAYKYYSIGKLSPGHIDQRAKRYAVKIFLSHLHHVWYEMEFKRKPPRPFAIEHLGHAHMIEPPFKMNQAYG